MEVREENQALTDVARQRIEGAIQFLDGLPRSAGALSEDLRASAVRLADALGLPVELGEFHVTFWVRSTLAEIENISSEHLFPSPEETDARRFIALADTLDDRTRQRVNQSGDDSPLASQLRSETLRAQA